MILRALDMNRCQCNVASTMGDRNQYPDTTRRPSFWKNRRNAYFLAYDHNRVVLTIKNEDENSHYINASYAEVRKMSIRKNH